MSRHDMDIIDRLQLSGRLPEGWILTPLPGGYAKAIVFEKGAYREVAMIELAYTFEATLQAINEYVERKQNEA
jgi:hypothetical protein